ncbi:hypothetical protein [Paenibacillus xylanexedens]|uniref:hypothetical protein n=1 Tax=Paenibacillus xylanexedens TaxID=528191 RepID=UPI003CFF23F3
MGLFEWIFDNLYIVAVVGFALFSFLGKAAKSADPNKKRPGNGMPTFGGSGDSDRPDRSPAQTSRQQPAPNETAGGTRYDEPYENPYDEDRYENPYNEERYESEQHDERYDQPYPEPAASSRTGMEHSLEQQMKEVERQERLIQERLNRFSSANKPVVSDSSWDIPNTDESGASPLRPEDVRTGVLWAEVLGPPRSKQPFGTRGKL